MADFEIRAGDRLPAISATITDGRPAPGFPDGAAVDLTGTVVRFVMRVLDGSRPLLDAAAVVVDPAAGEVVYEWGAGDTATPGTYLAEWQITFGDNRRLTVPNGQAIAIASHPGVADTASISAGDLAAIRSAIGRTTPPTDADIAESLARLGTTDAVIFEVLDARYTEMISGPGKWAVEGDFSLDNTVSIKALGEKLAEVKGRLATGPTITVATMTRADRSGR